MSESRLGRNLSDLLGRKTPLEETSSEVIYKQPSEELSTFLTS